MSQGEGEGHCGGIIAIFVRCNIVEARTGQACFG